MMFGLKTETMEAIREVLAKYPEVEKAILYGSRAIGNYRPGSDIDLTLTGEKLNLSILQKIENDLDDLLLPYKIDLSLHKQIQNQELLEHIERVGKVFFDRKPPSTPKNKNANHLSEWRETAFSDFVVINPAVRLPTNEPVSFVEMKDLVDGKRYCYPSSERQNGSGSKFQEFDTLFARITPCLENGKIAQVKGLKHGVGLGSTEFLIFRGKENVSDNDFVFYLSRWNEVRAHAEINLDGTSGRQRVPKECFNDLKLILPKNLQEQTAIASVLSSLDDKIDLLHRQNKTLEALAETLFRQWFVEEAKEEWEEVRLGNIIEIINGVSYKSDDLNSSKTAMVTLKSFDRNGGFRMDGFKEYTGKYKEQHILKEGDLVVAHTDITQEADVIGNPVMVIGNPKYDTLVFSMDLVKVVSKDENYSNEFLYLLMKSREFKEHCLGYSNGSTVLHLSKKAVPEYEMKLPPKNLIKEFSKKVKPLVQKQFRNQTQIRTLTQLRDTLLPKLMSGEVRVDY
jgi:type I restriction enzyme S subunit